MFDPATEVSAQRPVRAYLRTSGAPYLSVLLLSVVLAQFVQYLAPTQVIFKGQPAGVIVKVVLVAASFVLWWLFKPTDIWPPILRWLLAALALTWLITIALSVARDDLFNLTAFLGPVAIAMIWLKKPTLKATFTAGDVFAWGLVSIAAAAQLLDIFGIKSLNFEGWNRLSTKVWDQFPFLFRIIDYLHRWEGPFGNVNYAGPIGAFLLVYGLFRRGPSRVIFVLAGALIVIASDGRASLVASATGVLTAIILLPSIGRITLPTWTRIALAAAFGATAVFLLITRDPTLNGRTPIWSSYLAGWTNAPISGIGGNGITAAIGAGEVPLGATHGHSLFIDPLLRYGSIGTFVVILVVAIAVVIVLRAGMRGFVVGASIMATSIVDGLSEDLVDWRYLSIALVPIVLAAMLAATWLVDNPRERR